jgi:sugar/nucleoside kinase (ribokinase family)
VSLLVVGSIAFDTIHTPHGSAERVLGGSASYFSVVASHFTTPRLVGVVGNDFPQANIDLFLSRGIDVKGLARVEGSTFFWEGEYHRDMNTRTTKAINLGVFEHFQPVLPEEFRDSRLVFLANSAPETQARVLDQVSSPELVVADTMDFWINHQKDSLLRLLPRLDGLMLNDSEAMLLTGESNLVRAGHAVRKLGPKFVILKKGEHGAMLFSDDGVFVVPAFPTEAVIDPTGAGDSFAGGIMACLAADSDHKPGRLRRAMAYGTVVASLTVEGFGLDRLRTTTRQEIDHRLEQYRQMLAF